MTQLERLILTSSYKILNFQVTSQKDEQIIKSLDDILKNKNRDALGKEGTQQKRNSWDYIHKRIAEWWTKFYSAGGFALSIIQGLTQYCKYSDPTYKSMITRWLAGSFEEVERVDLPNWREEFSPEDFSLEGISVLAKLSILDEPLIIIFDQLEGLGLPHNGEILLNFGEAIKEIFTHVPNSLVILNMFPDRWKQFQDTFDNSIIGRVSQHQVHLTPPNETELKAILKVKLQGINLSLEQLFSSEDLEDILGQKPIRAVLNRAADYYNYKVRQIPLPVVTETLRKLDPYEKLEQQLRSFQQELQDLKQQQQLLIELVSHLSQTKQEPALIDLLTSPAFNIPVEPPTLNPLIDYLMRKKANLEKQYNQLPIISDYDDLGKLRTIAEAFSHLKPIKLRQYRLGKRVLPEHLVVETDHKNYVIGFLQITANTTSFTSRISNFNELVKMYSKDSFGLFRDQRLPEIKGKVAKEEIGKLQNTSNGNFVLLNQHDRIHFDLTYELIVDIQNKDLDVDLESALKVLIMNKEWYHDIFTMLGFTKPATDMN